MSLLELPYLKPVSFVGIELMHCLLLGIAKDFSKNYLLITAAGDYIQKEKKKSSKKGFQDDHSFSSKSSHHSFSRSSSNPSLFKILTKKRFQNYHHSPQILLLMIQVKVERQKVQFV